MCGGNMLISTSIPDSHIGTYQKVNHLRRTYVLNRKGNIELQ